ncbi:MAG: hypothetical protein AAF645_25010 [Myxococcota bacterium]
MKRPYAAALALVFCSAMVFAGGSRAQSNVADVALADFGVRMSAPVGSRIVDSPAVSGLLIQGPNFAINVTRATQHDPRDAASAASPAASGLLGSASDVNTEQLSDGFLVTLTTTTDQGSLYSLVGRRTIGNTSLMCRTTVMERAQRDAAAQACRSIRP